MTGTGDGGKINGVIPSRSNPASAKGTDGLDETGLRSPAGADG